ncbi:hypothetical protein ACODT3_39890 [Streptomyces sp. 4.24]|uniref:hypothetical protein n=1 Tax=Streptomyces tritrimontium TaxID=3406573 RepID=UPI003BB7C5F0
MSVRKTVGPNQSDSSHVKVIPAWFDRFGRGFSGGISVLAGARTHARGPVRFGRYTKAMTNTLLLTGLARNAATPVSEVA